MALANFIEPYDGQKMHTMSTIIDNSIGVRPVRVANVTSSVIRMEKCVSSLCDSCRLIYDFICFETFMTNLFAIKILVS